jgi:hypothetical protein
MRDEARAGLWDPELVDHFLSMLDEQKKVA